MMKLIIYAAVAVLLCSCHTSKSTQQPTTYFFADILSKDADTTYSYNVVNNLLYQDHTQYKFILPDSLGGNKLTGFVDFYSMINADKAAESIEILELALRKNDKKFIYYKKGYDTLAAQKPYYDRLKQYIYETVKTLPLKQNKSATLKLHPTYCYIRFGE
ncbi:hypothetical protein ACQ33O_04045 [Ferruginibacter sp. SUN002]|uniref:hypothetical protein n=1 Tax=Ferruginibacter sp. SUN002 TaxID=2937789 RepID=UPI003D36646A